MKYFSDILSKFTSNQRLIVLILLLFFCVGGFLTSQWMRTDDCKSLIKENLEMQQDFVKISEMLREEIMKRNTNFALDSAMVPAAESTTTTSKRKPASESKPIIIEEDNISLLENVQKIAESNVKK